MNAISLAGSSLNRPKHEDEIMQAIKKVRVYLKEFAILMSFQANAADHAPHLHSKQPSDYSSKIYVLCASQA